MPLKARLWSDRTAENISQSSTGACSSAHWLSVWLCSPLDMITFTPSQHQSELRKNLNVNILIRFKQFLDRFSSFASLPTSCWWEFSLSTRHTLRRESSLLPFRAMEMEKPWGSGQQAPTWRSTTTNTRLRWASKIQRTSARCQPQNHARTSSTSMDLSAQIWSLLSSSVSITRSITLKRKTNKSVAASAA